VVKSQDNEKSGSRDMIPMDELGPDGYSTIDHRDRSGNTKPMTTLGMPQRKNH